MTTSSVMTASRGSGETAMNQAGDFQMNWKSRMFVGTVVALGLGCLANAPWKSEQTSLFLLYLVISIPASCMKLRLPGLRSTMSLNFLFILIGILELSAGQALIIACAGALVQCFWNPKGRLRATQVAFSVSNIAVAVWTADRLFHWQLSQRLTEGTPLGLMAASLAFFAVNTAGIASVICLTERKPLLTTWRTCYFWSFLLYLIGASITWAVSSLDHRGIWHGLLLLVPVLVVTHRAYGMYLGRLEAEKKAREEVQLLFELTHDLGASLNLADTLALLSTRLKLLVPYDAIAISVCRDGRLIPEYVDGECFRLLSSLETRIGDGLSGWVAQTGKPILNGDPALDFINEGDPEDGASLRSALCLPLVGLTGTIGVMTLYRNEKDTFTPDHLRILLAASSRASLNIDNALKFRQVETTATIDYLTNLPNARSLFLRLDSELARSKRTRESITVLVANLDNFRQINERFGQAEGNKVLQAVANTLRESCREYDYVARMGGGEFVLIFPVSDMASMRIRMAEFREIGAKSGCGLPAMEGMTMSIGEALFPADGSDAEQLLAAADRRMYQARQASKAAPKIVAPALQHGLGLIQ
jgi:diguanylate cyclase (GGDEF)-like protein